MTDPTQRKRMGDAAKALVLDRYDAVKNSSAIVELMIDLAGVRS